MKKKYVSGLLLACIFLTTAFASRMAVHTISNLYTANSDVLPSQHLIIGPGPGRNMPEAMFTGVPYDLYLDVDNPNNQSLNGVLMLNITKTPKILTTDVRVTSYWGLTVINDGIYHNDTIVFELQQNGPSPYLRFDPGFRSNITCVTIQYNTEGKYNLTLAIGQ